MTSSRLNVCLLPMQVSWNDIPANLYLLESSIARVHPETDLLVLPETFSTGFPSGASVAEVSEIAETAGGSTLSLIKSLANKHNFAIAGTFVAKHKDSLINCAFFVEPNSDTTLQGKKHLFSMAGENNVFSPGSKRLQVRFRGWEIAMVVCYDIRFPVWCRNVDNAYDVLLTVANWPASRIDAWKKLLPARAIENLAYVAGVNCKGEDPHQNQYLGDALAFDFKGDEISVHQEDSPFTYASFSKEKLERFRSKFPAHLDADPFQLI